MRSLIALCLTVSIALSLPAPAQAGFGGRDRVASAIQPQTAKRGMGTKLKAGWRKLGLVGQGLTVLATGGAAAFGMHHVGMSPVEIGAAVGGVAAMGTTAMAILARRAKRLWTGSLAAQKLARIDEARGRNDLAAIEREIADLKNATANARVSNTTGQVGEEAQARETAYLSFALARAELALDGSSDPHQRLSGVTLATWNGELGQLDLKAASHVTPTSEGRLALRLRDVAAEIHAEQAVVARHEEVIARFEDHVPLGFGGAMGKEAKATRQLLAQLKDEEVGGEQQLHAKLTTAMRGRVSDRLAGEHVEFRQRRDRHGRLQTARAGALRQALAASSNIDYELASAIREREQEQSKRSEASQHTADPVEQKDGEGKHTGWTTQDNSGEYIRAADQHASNAESHARRAGSAISELETHLATLSRDGTIASERLSTPRHSLTNVSSFTSSEWTLRSARTEVESARQALAALDHELGRREAGEHAWMNGQIDADLSRQMAASK